MASRRGPTDWYVVVPQSAAGNFERAVAVGVWGAKDRAKFEHPTLGAMQPGDRVHFIVSPVWEGDGPRPQAFPRLNRDVYAVRAREVTAEVTSPLYEDTATIWSDALYPVRFRFAVRSIRDGVRFVPGVVPDAVREAIFLSHNQQAKAFPAPPTKNREFSLQQALQRVLGEYAGARRESYDNHPLAQFIRQGIPTGLKTWPACAADRYIVDASAGQGQWVRIPWIAVMDRRITTTVQEGLYVVYLFADDLRRVYLALHQGVTRVRKEHGARAGRGMLVATRDRLRAALKPRFADWETLRWDNDLNLGASALGRIYRDAAIAYLEYPGDRVPDDNALEDDLTHVLNVYEVASGLWSQDGRRSSPSAERAAEERPTYGRVPFTLDAAMEVMKQRGYRIHPRDLANVLLCLTVRPFVIFSGRSGTGKTSLARLIAELFGWPYYMAAVSPAWADPSDLLGFVSPLAPTRRVPGALEELLTGTADDAVLCLDEFNVAKVEHYFSDFLSAMDGAPTGFWARIPALERLNREAQETSPRLRVPAHLKVIATMNFDDSVQSVTPRVLDRANVVEFDVPGADALMVERRLRWDGVDGQPVLQWPPVTEPASLPPEWAERLRGIWLALRGSRAQFGHRVAQEMTEYAALGLSLGSVFGPDESTRLDALLDRQLVQRVLPKLQGTGQQRDVDALMRLLHRLTAADPLSSPDTVSEHRRILDEARNQNRFPLTAAKVEQLVTSYTEDGYAAFW
jgi:5-methylcytosine-specific restriction protein B